MSAFDYLRQFFDVDEATETLVKKRTTGRIKESELITIFEKAAAGDYGKVYKAEAQTLLGWVNKFVNEKSSAKNYLESGLLDPGTKPSSINYPRTTDDWCKEANKCFTAFLNGVGCEYFHPQVYDRMLLDNKIELNAYKKYCKEDIDKYDFSKDDEMNDYINNHVNPAKQKVLRDIFAGYKQKGWSSVYVIATV